MTAFRDVREITAWQLANQLRIRVDIFVHSPDFRRHYTRCERLSDAARSGPRSIAEGHARFRRDEFARFVRIARESEAEVLHHLIEARDQRLITDDEFAINEELIRRAMSAAAALIRDLESTPNQQLPSLRPTSESYWMISW
jgi:four helix bundle protein